MSGDIEKGRCTICGKVGHLDRKYYYYHDIKCSCCNKKTNGHFEIIWYCSTCEPKPPEKIVVYGLIPD